MARTPDDLNEAIKQVLESFQRNKKRLEAKRAASMKKIIADGVAKARRGHTLSKSDNRFLKTIRVSAW